MKKKILSIALMIMLLLGMIFVLTGCGSDNKSGNTDNKSSNTDNKDQVGKLADIVNVGDYVNYNANSGNGVGKSYTTEESLTGSSSTTTFRSSDEMKWKVIRVDKSTGIVELMAEKPTENSVCLKGKIGYKNAETVLNKVGEVYGYGEGATGGRSITVEDVNKLENYTPTDDVSTSYTYTKGSFINEDGTEVVATKENPVTIKCTSNTAEKSTNKYYDYGTKNFKGESFWLASRCIRAYSNSNYCYFGVRYMDPNWKNGSLVSNNNLFISDRGDTDSSEGVVPIISLKSNIQTNGKDESGAWNLKID